MKTNKLVLGLAGVTAAGLLAVGGASFASAETTPSPTTAGTTQSQDGTQGQSGQSAPGQSAPGQGAPGQGQGPGGGSQDTPVTGDTKAKIEAAVKAKDSGISITEVRMDPDGSYDVLGTSGGQQVFYDVSKDLATITLNAGPAGGHGGPGGDASSSDSNSANGSAANGSAAN